MEEQLAQTFLLWRTNAESLIKNPEDMFSAIDERRSTGNVWLSLQSAREENKTKAGAETI